MLALRYILSLPERALRGLAAFAGGLLYELTKVALPTWMRDSRLYQSIIARLLRITIELIGDVQGVLPVEVIDSRELATRKFAGNVIEVASFLAVGWSPLWILAAAADLTGGTQTYLRALVVELQCQGVLPEGSDISSAEELLETLETTSGAMADMVDIPPLNVSEMRQTWDQLKKNAADLPNTARLARLYTSLEQVARQEGQSIGSVSGIIATSAMRAGVQIGHTYIFDFYRQAFTDIQKKGLTTFTIQAIEPYVSRAVNHFDPHRTTRTERILQRKPGKGSERSPFGVPNTDRDLE